MTVASSVSVPEQSKTRGPRALDSGDDDGDDAAKGRRMRMTYRRQISTGVKLSLKGKLDHKFVHATGKAWRAMATTP